MTIAKIELFLFEFQIGRFVIKFIDKDNGGPLETIKG